MRSYLLLSNQCHATFKLIVSSPPKNYWTNILEIIVSLALAIAIS
ncbi:MAG: hypothetical protein V7K47_14700 [Nostoc sp.]